MRIYRGNTLHLKINITMQGIAYTLADGDIVTFTVKRQATKNSEILLQKTLNNSDYNELGELVMRIEPTETADIPNGQYKFDVAIKLADSEFYTIIPPDDFIISGVVTEYGGDSIG